jgi:MinD superfamily P-loop ATPase
MIVTVASGKGGTGKTTVAVGLALSLGHAQLLDADAEEPNAHLFLHPTVERSVPIYMMVPDVDSARCNLCGECAAFCRFNALAVVGERVLVFRELCHGCTGCVYACPVDAIRPSRRQIGEVEVGSANGVRVIQGRLTPGEPSGVPIVREEFAQLERDGPAIVDAAPGTACVAQEAIEGADYCLLVTEPTPFGVHDLRLAANSARELGTPAGVLINRSGQRDGLVDEECARLGLPVLLKIPFSREIAEAYSMGRTLIDVLPEYRERLRQLYADISARAGK